jgi:hypothetical protein
MATAEEEEDSFCAALAIFVGFKGHNLLRFLL